MSQQRTAVVTGANSGFGRATVEALAAGGWRVYATMRDLTTRNAEAAAELRAQGISVVELDVLSDASVEAAAHLIIDEAGAPDLLVNNAGNGYMGLEEAFTVDAVERQFATNVFGPLRVDRAFLPAMRAAGGGLIVFVSSVVARVVFPFTGVYTASKWALDALAEALSYEVSSFGIDVAIVQPGAYPTDIGAKMNGPDDTARVAAYGAFADVANRVYQGLGEAAEGRDPADVARAIVALADQPAGTRPLRTVVPSDAEGAAASAINAAVGPLQHEALRAFGLGDLVPAP
jgi:NAD(P)-dependent dehydrogenase (short-subunit alcohol dehydrogenase family)